MTAPHATNSERAITPGKERFAIADEIERCVKGGHHKAYGTSSSQSTLTAGNEWWITVAKLLRETSPSETAPLVAGDLAKQREIHDTYAPVSATRPSIEAVLEQCAGICEQRACEWDSSVREGSEQRAYEETVLLEVAGRIRSLKGAL